MRKNGIVLAIDGPAGVGKSSVGRTVAEKIGYGFINTGEMYRALAWKMAAEGIGADDEDKVAGLAGRIRWEFKKVAGPTIKTFVDGRLMDKELLEESVSKNSSAIAKNARVREFMKSRQQELGRDGGIVMEGRDIGTAVFPDAELKIYLDASPEKRAQRRHDQLKAEGIPADYQAILDGIISRDRNDSGRKLAPLKKAEDSVVIDTSLMTIGQVIDEILRLAKAKCSLIC